MARQRGGVKSGIADGQDGQDELEDSISEGNRKEGSRSLGLTA